MIKGIIFDKDGILFDMEPVYCKICINVLKEHGINLSEEEYYDFWTKRGGTLKDFLEIKKIKANFDLIQKNRGEMLISALSKRVPIIKGAAEMVQKMYLHYPLALVTSSYKEGTDILLDNSGLRKYFGHVIAREDVKKGKPDPEGFLLAGKRMGISSENILVIEDAEKGVVAAKTAGMKVAAVPNEYTRHNDFSKADYILRDIKEITPDFLASIN